MLAPRTNIGNEWASATAGAYFYAPVDARERKMRRLQGICNEPVKALRSAAFQVVALGEEAARMRTLEACAIERAITTRGNGAFCANFDLGDDDVDALAEQFAAHTVGMTPADAVGEALIVGILAGRQLGPVKTLSIRSVS